MYEHLSPKQVARAVGVSEASLKRWCDKGLIPTIRTVGGHRRLPLNKVIEFIRKTGHPLVRPEVLGLPPTTGRGEVVLDRAREQIREALEAGDDECFRRLGFDLYLAGQTALQICDRVIAPTFHALGMRWQHGNIEVYQERRACEIVVRFLHELRAMLPSVPPDAPRAIVATSTGDPYVMPVTMVDLVLHEAGWKSACYGTDIPFETLKAALTARKPKLFCLSVSAVPDDNVFIEEYAGFYRHASGENTVIAVGGRALTAGLRAQMKYANFSENLEKLVEFGNVLKPPVAPSPARTVETLHSN